MRISALVVIGTICLSATVNGQLFLKDQVQPNGLDVEFSKYMARYGKSYESREEYIKRRSLFERQLMLVGYQNSQNGATYQVGLNAFSDLTDEEFEARYLGDKGQAEPESFPGITRLAQATDVSPIDWREKGFVGPVKDQGHCGSCWAFSTVGPTEEHYYIKYGYSSLTFSEQQLVDCSVPYGNNGCNGGLFAQGYEYVQAYGLEASSDYPYLAADGNCTYDASKVKVHISGTVQAERTPEGLKQILQDGPASISLHASDPSFRAYTGGIYNNLDCPTAVNHAVQTVGWGHDEATGLNYFIVRNSWGPSWGAAGYIKIAESNTPLGICGMLYRIPTYPIIV